MAHLSLRLLGPFEASLDGQALSGFRSNKVRALLAYLCVEYQRPWSRATLADLLWADFPEESARSNLRNALSNLRRVIGDREADPTFLQVSRTTLQFNTASDCWVDIWALLGLLPEVDQDRDSFSDREAIPRLNQALDLYRGDLLEGLTVASAPFEEWLFITRRDIRRKLLRAVHMLALASARLGDLEASTGVTRRWLALEPWDEAAHRHLMRLLALRGRRSAALAQYDTCREILSTELGAEPGPETARLYEQIREGRSGTSIGALSRSPEWPGFERRMAPPVPESLAAAPSGKEPALFVDREEEMETLARALAGAVRGKGGIRFVTGEPGSGKTALLAEFARQALARHPELLVAWGRCSAFTGRGDPYFPFQNIARVLSGLGEVSTLRGAEESEHIQRVWQSLPATVGAMLDHGPDLIGRFVSGRDLLALARLHGGVRPDRLTRLQSLVQQSIARPPGRRLRQAALFGQFTRVLSTLAQRRPLLLVVDDMQWIDPGSVSLLFHLARRVAGRRILLLGAYRPHDPSLQQADEPHPLLDVIGELKRDFGDIHVDLMESEGAAFVDALIDNEPNELDQAFRDLLYRHTSGNPLFTIELLHAMQLRGDLRRSPQGRWVEGPQLNWDELPARVEAVVDRRIRHLSPACQELLRAASVEGEQFTAQVLANVLQEDLQHVCDLLSREAGKQHRLVAAQIVRWVNGQELALYRFRHALFQIHLYHQLDVVERFRIHGLVARELEAIYQGNLDQFPELAHSLARHFEFAGQVHKAVRYYTHAGKNAVRVSANREALTHFYTALRLLKGLPPSPERDRQELDLQLSLGPPLTATKGWAPPEIGAAYARAQELCERIDDDARLIPALWLLEVYRLGRSEHAQAERLVERLYRLAQHAGDPALLAVANLQVTSFYQGRFAEARRWLEQAAAAPDLEQQRQIAVRLGMAPAVVGLAYLAECLWLTGHPDRADQHSQEARELAERIHHPMTTCYALGRSCWLAALKGDVEGVRRFAAAWGTVAEEFRLETFAVAARFFTDWADVQRGAPTTGRIGRMQQALDEYRATGTVLNRTAFLTLFAQACGTAEEIARGLAAVDESLALADETGERWFQAETLRVKGKLLRLQASEEAQPEEALSAAAACFQKARRLAREQGATSFELRAAVSVCQLRQSQSEENKGRDVLLRILDQFDDGLDTIDIRRANALLHGR